MLANSAETGANSLPVGALYTLDEAELVCDDLTPVGLVLLLLRQCNPKQPWDWISIHSGLDLSSNTNPEY